MHTPQTKPSNPSHVLGVMFLSVMLHACAPKNLKTQDLRGYPHFVNQWSEPYPNTLRGSGHTHVEHEGKTWNIKSAWLTQAPNKLYLSTTLLGQAIFVLVFNDDGMSILDLRNSSQASSIDSLQPYLGFEMNPEDFVTFLLGPSLNASLSESTPLMEPSEEGQIRSQKTLPSLWTLQSQGKKRLVLSRNMASTHAQRFEFKNVNPRSKTPNWTLLKQSMFDTLGNRIELKWTTREHLDLPPGDDVFKLPGFESSN